MEPITRRLDELGRLVFPIEFRKQLDWNESDPITMTITGDSVNLRKKIKNCFICGSSENLTPMEEDEKKAVHYLCRGCIERLYKTE